MLKQLTPDRRASLGGHTVGDVRCPDMIRARDLQMAQQREIDRVCRMLLAGVGLAAKQLRQDESLG